MVVYLIEEWFYDSYNLCGCYDNLETAKEVLNDVNFEKEYNVSKRHTHIREVGVRKTKSLRPVAERSVE